MHPSVYAPARVNAGQVLDLDVVSIDFVLTGDHAVAVGSFLVGAEFATGPNPNVPNQGDPSQTTAIPVEQFRTKAVFLAPDDYDASYIDVVMKPSTHLTLDGATVTRPSTPIGSSGFSVVRIELGPGVGGAHLLSSDQPVGAQVIGYGKFTSYQYPAGLDLAKIAPPIL